MKNGVPFDVAFSLSTEERTAWGIIFCEFEGGSYDWDAMTWRKPEGQR